MSAGLSTPDSTTPATSSEPDVGFRRLLTVAWPLALHGLVSVGVSMNDVVLLGREGALVIASAVVASSLLTVVVIGVAAFAVATQIEASRARGAGDSGGAVAAVEGSLRLVLTLAAPVLLVLWLAAPVLTAAVAGSAADSTIAGDYLRITLLGVPLALGAAVLRAWATALGRTRVVLVAGVVAAGTDVAVSLALLPVWGWRGVAIGTVCGYAASAGSFLVWRLRLEVEHRPGLRLRPVGTERHLFALGWPEALLATFSTASGVVVVFVLAGSTPAVLAGVRLLEVQSMLAFVVLLSVGQAMLTLLGEAIGADRPDLFARARRHGLLVVGVLALVMYVVAAPLSGLFVRVVGGPGPAAAVGWLGLLAWLQVFWQAANVVLVTTCRALRDTRAALVASLVAEYAVFLPLGLLVCRVLGWDVLGVLVAHHAFWATFVAIVAWRARAAVRRTFGEQGLSAAAGRPALS
ncbi:MATE family efflux transporter [Nocardioides sp.]|uniref:MATE family efflux transporter n=1 Tax=Nocardioides sp. TaxID=35761 RepID=UPI002734350C|nr:MATE family efflux transporter [Nocardioides sp.]MDP3890294.1 MATE family efflux transporter [Nocardioides sp.]